jgi:hypothetical protein
MKEKIISPISIVLVGCKKNEPDTENPVIKKDVIITWETPNEIVFPEALSATQLNASANVEGTFVYSPPSETVLNIGTNQVLQVDFTPANTTIYNTATKTVLIPEFDSKN